MRTVIDATARIHASAGMAPDVSVRPRTSISHCAHLRASARIGADCVIGRDAFIGPNAILTNDRYPRAITASGEPARADDWTVSPITLRHRCSIGGGAVVVAATEVGRYPTVGVGAILTRDVPAHALVVGIQGATRGEPAQAPGTKTWAACGS